MVNKVILIGNAGADPEVRYLEPSKAVATLRFATTEVYSRNGKREEHTEWHRVIFWGKLAERVETYVKKGALLYIEGRIRYNEWDDKNNVHRYTTEIIADSMKMLGKATAKSSQDYNMSNIQQDTISAPISNEMDEKEQNDDLPF